MPLLLADRNYLSSIGVNPDDYDVDASGSTYVQKTTPQPSIGDNDFLHPKVATKPPETGTALQAGVRSFGQNALPTAAGGAAFMGAAGPLMPWAIAAAPASFGASMLVPLGAGAIAGGLSSWGTRKAQHAAQEAIMPEYLANTEQIMAAHPTAATIGGIATMPLGGLNPNPMNVVRAAGTIPKLLTRGGLPVTAPEIQNLMNVGVGGVLAPVQDIGTRLAEGQPMPTIPELMGDVGLGAAFNSPNAIGRMLGMKPATLPKVLPGRGQLTTMPPTAAPPERPIELPQYMPTEPIPTERALVLTEPEKFRQPAEQPGRLFSDESIIPASEEPAKPTSEYPRTKFEQEHLAALSDKNIPPDLTPEGYNMFAAFARKMRNTLMKVSPSVKDAEGNEMAGSTQTNPDLSAYIEISKNPNVGSIRTIPHEMSHAFANQLAESPRTADKNMMAGMYSAIEKSPEFADYNARRVASGRKPVDAKEFAAIDAGAEYWHKALNLSGESEFKTWYKDFASYLKTRFSPENALPSDYRRLLNYRFENDPAFDTYFKTGKVVPETGATVAPKHSDEQTPVEGAFESGRKSWLSSDGKEVSVSRYHNAEGKNILDKAKIDTSKMDVNQIYDAMFSRQQARINETDRALFVQTGPGKGLTKSQLNKLQDRAIETKKMLIHEETGKRAKVLYNPENQFSDESSNKELPKAPLVTPTEQSTEKSTSPYEKLNEADRSEYNRLHSVAMVARQEHAKLPSDEASNKLIDSELAISKFEKEKMASDSDRYNTLQDQMKGTKDFNSKEFQDAWKESESLKNKNGGRVPTDKQYSDEPQKSMYLRGPEFTKEEWGAGDRLLRGDQVANRLRNATDMGRIPRIEYDIYKEAGIDDFLKDKTVTPSDVSKWMDEHGPKVEVHSYGMEGKVSEAKMEYDKMTHEWYDNQPIGIRLRVDAAINGDATTEMLHEHIASGKGTLYTTRTNPKWAEQANRYIELAKQTRNEPRDTSPRATSAYEGVSAFNTHEPMPEWTKSKEGRNVQRVDVVIPQKQELMPENINITGNSNTGYYYVNKAGKQVSPKLATHEAAQDWVNEQVRGLWQPDNLHENLPNTLGWAMIQYKTGPKGEKMAVVVEAQSRWGQEVREWLNKARKQAEKEGITLEQILERPGYKSHENAAPNHPLLKDYNRLILKAAIEQARKEGADHVTVVDAESAMMAEWHDQQAGIANNENNVLGHQYIQQEQGMRLNYDPNYRIVDKKGNQLAPETFSDEASAHTFAKNRTAGLGLKEGTYELVRGDLHSIAEELTGSKGERVSMGEHKNAFRQGTPRLQEGYQSRSHAERAAQMNGIPIENVKQLANGDWGIEDKIPRDNLIFGNGTPKTDASGMMYPLKDAASPQSMLGKRYSDEPSSRSGEPYIDPSHTAFGIGNWRPMEATNREIGRTVDKNLGEALDRWRAQRDNLVGLKNTAIADLQQFNKNDVNRVRELHREAYENGKKDLALSGNDKEISDILTRYYHDEIRKIQIDSGLLIEGRKAGENKFYVGDMLNAESIDMLANHPTSTEAKRLVNMWVKRVVDKSGGKITEAEARTNIIQYIRAMGSDKSNYLSVTFGAARKAAGYGLPDSMRELDTIRALDNYGRRMANDLAMYKELESKPDIANMLLLKDPNTGKFHSVADENSMISANPLVKDAMKWVTGGWSGTIGKNSQKISSFVRAVNSGLLQTATGIRNTAQAPAFGAIYLNKLSDLGAVFNGIVKMQDNSRDALLSGARQPNIDKLQFNELLDAPDRFTAIARKAAVSMRKWSGAEAIENFNRDITFSIGKELALHNIELAKTGDKQSINFLKKFGLLVDTDPTTLKGKDLETAINQMAKNFTDRNQGTYSGSGLPAGIMDSQFAPFFALQKWSIEKSNVIYQDVFKPFMSGENRLPMLTYLLGTMLTGAAIQELNELITGRKGQDPTIKEALAVGDSKAIVSEMITLAQLASFAGIVGDGLKFASDVGLHGKMPRNIVSFPTATAALNFEEKTKDLVEAINQGENPWEVFKNYSIDLMTHQIQTARIVANHTIKDEDVERSDKFRDRRVFNELQDKPASDIIKSNPYLDLGLKKFKRTDDLNEAAKLLPELLGRAVEKAKGNPERLKVELQKIKQNNYQTMPSPDSMPIEFIHYYQYVQKTQGDDKAVKLLTDYITQNQVNKVKSSLVPSL